MMRKIILASAAFTLISSQAAIAHHPSPAEPEIGDMMGMHDAAIARVLEETNRPSLEEMDEMRSDNVGSGLDNSDSMQQGGE